MAVIVVLAADIMVFRGVYHDDSLSQWAEPIGVSLPAASAFLIAIIAGLSDLYRLGEIRSFLSGYLVVGLIALVGFGYFWWDPDRLNASLMPLMGPFDRRVRAPGFPFPVLADDVVEIPLAIALAATPQIAAGLIGGLATERLGWTLARSPRRLASDLPIL